MADDPGGEHDCRASDLDLLRSGKFADVRIVCKDRTWNCHRAILTSRSIWFRKALDGPFQEASTREVNLNEENPICIDLALKHIYGGGLNVESSVSDEHFVEHCVLLWHTADFLLLHPLKFSVQQAVRRCCDKRMKLFCTEPTHEPKSISWVLDVVLGIRSAYEWKIGDLKSVLMEFIWVGRSWIFTPFTLSTFRDHLKNTPDFMDDLLIEYASSAWIKTAVWAPVRQRNHTASKQCGLCFKDMIWSEDAPGQVLDPFSLDQENLEFVKGWCRDCSKGDTIPWRV